MKPLTPEQEKRVRNHEDIAIPTSNAWAYKLGSAWVLIMSLIALYMRNK